MAGLRDVLDTTQPRKLSPMLRDLYGSPVVGGPIQEVAVENTGDFGRGLRSAVSGSLSGAQRYVGANEAALENQLDAQQWAPEIATTDQVDGFGTGIRYGMGKLGGAAGSLPIALTGGVAGRALAGAKGAYVGATAAYQPVMAGGHMQDLDANPNTAGMSETDKRLRATGIGAAQALVEGAGPAWAINRLAKPRALLKPGFGEAVKRGAGVLATDAALEGAGAAASDVMGQGSVMQLDPKTGYNPRQTFEAGVGEAVGGAGMGAVHAPLTVAADIAVRGAKAAPGVVGDAITAGKAGVGAATEGINNPFKTSADFHAQHPELEGLLRPPTIPDSWATAPLAEQTAYMNNYEAERNASARTMAERMLADENTSNADMAEARALLESTDPKAWEAFAKGVDFRQKKDQVAGALGHAASQLRAKYEQARTKVKGKMDDIRAKADLAGIQHNKELTQNDRDFYDSMMPTLKTIHELGREHDVIAPTVDLLQTFLLARYGENADANGFAELPDALVKVYKDSTPGLVAKAFENLYRLGMTPGYDPKTVIPELTAEMNQVVKTKQAHYKSVEGVIRDNLVPAKMDTLKDYTVPEMADRIGRYIDSGKRDNNVEDYLDEHFGVHKELVLEQIDKLRGDHSPGTARYDNGTTDDAVDGEDRDSDANLSDGGIADEDFNERGSPINEVDGAATNYHLYTTERGKKKQSFDTKDPYTEGNIERTILGLTGQGLETRYDKNLGKRVVRHELVGAVDHARASGDNTEMTRLFNEHQDLSEQQINDRFKVIRTKNVRPASAEPIDIGAQELAESKTSSGKTNPKSWADVTEIDNPHVNGKFAGTRDVSTIAHGRIHLTRNDDIGAPFVTSAQKIITKMFERKTAGAFDEHTAEMTGPQQKLAMFAAGLTSLMNSGKFHDEIQIKMPDGTMKVVNGLKSLPDDFVLYQGKDFKVTMKDALGTTDKATRAEEQKKVWKDKETGKDGVKKEVMPKAPSEKFEISDIPTMTRDELRAEYAATKKSLDSVEAQRAKLAEDSPEREKLAGIRDGLQAKLDAFEEAGAKRVDNRAPGDAKEQGLVGEKAIAGREVTVLDRDEKGHIFSKTSADKYAGENDTVVKRGDRWVVERDIGPKIETKVTHLSESEEMADAARVRHDNKVRTHDEATGEELHPKQTLREKIAARKAAESKISPAETPLQTPREKIATRKAADSELEIALDDFAQSARDFAEYGKGFIDFERFGKPMEAVIKDATNIFRERIASGESLDSILKELQQELVSSRDELRVIKDLANDHSRPSRRIDGLAERDAQDMVNRWVNTYAKTLNIEVIFTDKLREFPSPDGGRGPLGLMWKGNKKHRIYISIDVSNAEQAISVLAHEFGHAMWQHEYDTASPGVKKSLRDAHARDVAHVDSGKSTVGEGMQRFGMHLHFDGTLSEVKNSYYGMLPNEMHDPDDPYQKKAIKGMVRDEVNETMGRMEGGARTYALSFDEWMANQFSKFVLSNGESTLPLPARNFIRRMIDRLEEFFDGVVKKLIPAAEFSEFVKELSGKYTNPMAGAVGVLNNMESTELHKMLNRSGFAATHDSPIKHEGKFDWQKNSGKGEGSKRSDLAEDYGAGTYLSSADEVHEFYKEQFTQMVNELVVLPDHIDKLWQQYLAADDARSNIASERRALDMYDKSSKAVSLDEAWVKADTKANHLQDTFQEVYDKWREANPRVKSPTYHVSVNAQSEELLNWDVPMSEQSTLVQEALYQLFEDKELGNPDDIGHVSGATGRMLYEEIAKELGSKRAASEALQEYGLVGHKYNSKAGDGGKKGSPSNYVIYDDSKIETNFVSFNKETTGLSNDRPMNDMEAIEAIYHLIGKDVNAAFATKGALSGSGAWGRDAKTQQAIIRIAANALDPMSVAYHESMHEFFQRAMDDKNLGGIHETLRKVASSELILRQMMRHFAAEAEVLKDIESNPAERVAYMFQLWAAGKLHVGPETETVFRKIINMVKKVLGMMTADQKALEIMQEFTAGNMSDRGAMARVLNTQEARGAYLRKVGTAMKPVVERGAEIVGFAENILADSGNPALIRIGKQFNNKTGSQGDEQGLLSAEAQATNKWMNVFAEALRHGDKEDVRLAMEGLQKKEDHADPIVRKIQEGIKQGFRDIYGYLAGAEVMRWDEKAGDKGEWVPIKKIDDYRLPVSWDASKIIANSEKFKALLHEHHEEALNKIADQANAEVAAKKDAGRYTASWEELQNPTGKQLTAEDIANALVNRVISTNGQVEFKESEAALGFSPFAKAVNERTLSNWINAAAFAEFQEKDMALILTTYVGQATKRAEYSRRFGPDGGKLQASMEEAWHHEIDKIMKEKYKVEFENQSAVMRAKEMAAAVTKLGKTTTWEEQLGLLAGGDALGKEVVTQAAKNLEPARRAVMAMEGTLGHDISPLARKVNAYSIVYQNMRLLGYAMFSNIVDPLGIVVRGGEFKDAYATFKRGMRDVGREWGSLTGLREVKESDRDEAVEVAEMIGTVSSSAFMSTMGNMYGSQYLGKFAREANDSFFRWNGMEAFNKAMRVGATQAAISFIKRHHEKPNKHSDRYFKELNLDPKDVKIGEDGRLNVESPAVQQAVMRWVDGAQLRPNAAMRPTMASDPHYASFYHLKQFAYVMQAVILKRVQVEIKNGNTDPLMLLLAGYVPVMLAADSAKGLIQVMTGGGAPMWQHEGVAGVVWQGVTRAGLLGPAQMAVDVAEYGPLGLGGPMVEQIGSAVTDPIGKTVAEAVAIGPTNMMLRGTNWDN